MLSAKQGSCKHQIFKTLVKHGRSLIQQPIAFNGKALSDIPMRQCNASVKIRCGDSTGNLLAAQIIPCLTVGQKSLLQYYSLRSIVKPVMQYHKDETSNLASAIEKTFAFERQRYALIQV